MQDKAHIDALVALAVRGPQEASGSPDQAWLGVRWIGDPDANPMDVQRAEYYDADRIGVMLWAENVASVQARYPDTIDSGEYPGRIGFTLHDVADYTWPMRTPRLTAAEGLKALDGYEYQSCEHDGWHTSEAYRFCEALRRVLVGHVPGYSEADTWAISGHEASPV